MSRENQSSQEDSENTRNDGSLQSDTNHVTTSPQRKKKSRKWIWIPLLILLCGGGWYAYQLMDPGFGGPRINPLHLIPGDAIYILETDRPYTFWDKLGETPLWQILEKDEDWKEYGQTLNELENTLSGFDQALDLLTNRTVFISAHPYQPGKSDYLFLVDLHGLAVIRTWLTSLDQVTTRPFQGETIYEKFDRESRETLYFAFHDQFLIASFTHSLVEAAIAEKDQATLGRSFDFIDIRKKVRGEGLVRMYVNYERLFSELRETIGEKDFETVRKNLPFIFSGLYFDVAEETLLLEGYSNYADSLPTYLRVFSKAGAGPADIARVAPSSTSVYLSLGFDSFEDFYEELHQQLSQDALGGEDYQNYARRTERFLDISLKDDLAAWIDNEIAVIQIESGGKSESALILKARSASLAREKMDFLSRQIKRKTPVRFRAVDYQGYPINYMAVKGLFNLVFGGLFEKYDRPYFTIINEYVIFSSRPQVLRLIIDSWKTEQTLANVSSYRHFVEALEEEHSVMLYLQPPLLGASQGAIIDQETSRFLQSKNGILHHFPQLGFNISPSGSMFRTHVQLSVLNSDPVKRESLFVPMDTDFNYDSLWQLDPGEQIVVSQIEVEDFSATRQSEVYETGTPRYEVEVKNGQKHGDYFEYHATGELKVKGRYRNDQKDGTWKYYDEKGDLVKREKYRKGELVGG